jgi:hypothetical protein
MKFAYTEISSNLIPSVSLVLNSDPFNYILIDMNLDQNAEFVNDLKKQEAYVKRLENAFIGYVSNEMYDGEAEKLLDKIKRGESDV